MKIANADKLKKHFENVVDVKLFTVPEICTIIDRFSMNMAITDDEKMLSLNEEYVIVPSLEEGKWKTVEGIDGDDYYECSKCGEPWTLMAGTPKDNNMNYCPNCGAWMIGGDKP